MSSLAFLQMAIAEEGALKSNSTIAQTRPID
jgi:hypothetical protein